MGYLSIDITPEIEGAVAAAVANGYAAAYAFVYYAAIAVGLVGLIACCCIKNYDPYFNNHVSRQIYRLGKEKEGAVDTWNEKLDGDMMEKNVSEYQE